MFKKTALIIVLASLTTGIAGSVSAASLSDQWYVGAGYSNSQLLPRAEANTVTRVEEIGQGATVFFGRDFDERSSGQFQLYSHGEVIFSDDSTATYTGADASLLYRFYDSRDNRRNAVFGVSVYGRFGFGFTERDSDNPLSTEGASPVYFGAGAGLEAYLSKTFALRSELLYHEQDTVSASLSLVTRFGGRKTQGTAPPPIPSRNSLPATNNTAPSTPEQFEPQQPTTAAPVVNPQALPFPSNGPPTQITRAEGSPSGSINDLPEVAIMVNKNELPEVAIMTQSNEFPNTTTTASVARRNLSDVDNDGVTDDVDQCRLSPRNYPVNQVGCSLLMQLATQIKFVENSPIPQPGTEQVLALLAAQMNQFPATRIELIAHTDNTGDPQAKSALTRQRLRAIGIYLVQRGIIQDRFLLRSFGGKRPAFSNSSTEGRRANNRIEIVERP